MLHALNCFNMSERMSDEHVLGTPGAPPCRATCPASEPCQARAKVGILPRKKNPVLPWGEDCSTLFFANGCEAPAARHRSPAAPARHRSPAEPAPRSGFFHRGRDSDFALHRGRFSDFALASDFPRKILRKRCDGERIASGVGFHPEKPITGPAPKVRQRCCPRSIADGVFFFTTYTPCRQSCCGNRIALVNPAVATGLLHPILLWQQDCSTQLPGFKFGK